MSVQVLLPQLEDVSLYAMLREIMRRVVDGTTGFPIFSDEANQRVIIGSKTASASPAKLEVNGDVKVIGSGKGFIVANRAGTKYYRLIIENNGAISADPL